MTTINQASLSSAVVTLPPLDEQKKIAYVLSTVQRAIAQQEQLIQTTTELKKALMHKLFTEGLHGEKQKETEIGFIPKNWEFRPIGSLKTIVQSGQTPLRNKKEYYGGNIKWVKTLDLNGDVVIKTEECLTNEGFSALGRKLRPVDTVMVAMYGGAGTIGKAGIKATTNQAVCCIEPNYEVFNPRYLLHYFINFRPNWMRFAIGTRKDPNISKTTIINTQIPLPSLEEQNKIVKVLDTVTRKISHAEAKKILLNDLFQTLLHQLMTAQIRLHDIDLPGFDDLANITLQDSRDQADRYNLNSEP